MYYKKCKILSFSVVASVRMWEWALSDRTLDKNLIERCFLTNKTLVMIVMKKIREIFRLCEKSDTSFLLCDI